MNLQALALAFLAATAIGGLAWVFIYPLLSGERKAELRRASVAKPEPAARQADKSQRSRREQVEGSLKELEARSRDKKKVPLTSRLTQAGLAWSPRKFMILSGVLAAACFAITMLAGGGLIGAAGLALTAGLGLPRWNLPKAEENLRRAYAGGRADARVRQNLGLVVGLQGRFVEAESIVKADLPPEEAASNVAYLKQMLSRKDGPRAGLGSVPAASLNRS